MIDPDQLSDEEKIKLGIESLKSFWDLFGENDIYKQVFLEELMKFIKDLPADPSSSSSCP